MALVPYFDIGKTVNGEKTIYLRRFYLVRTQWFNIFLHQFFRSDDDPDPHDHPWSFISFPLTKGYVEERYVFYTGSEGMCGERAGPFEPEPNKGQNSNTRGFQPKTGNEQGGVRFSLRDVPVRPWTFNYRPAETIHRVILTKGPCWTLVFGGRERRPWGFAKHGSWVFWRQYLNVWNSQDHA